MPKLPVISPTSEPDRHLARIALVGLLAVIAAAWFATPGESAWLPSCPIYKLTGLYCPGCGTTRMLFYLVHGRPIEAFRYNPLTFCIFPIAICLLLRNSFFVRLPALPRPSSRWIAGVILLVIVFTAARNIPAEPFRTLAPPEVQLRDLNNPVKPLSFRDLLHLLHKEQLSS